MLNYKSVRILNIGLLCVALSGCGLFGKDKLVIEGDRIAFLDNGGILQPDFQEGTYKINLPEAVTNISWNQEGGNATHDMGHLNSADVISELWDESFGKGSSKRDILISSPVVQNRVIYTIDAEANVSAFNLDDGDELWNVELERKIESNDDVSMKGAGIAVWRDKVFASTGYGSVFALDASNGAEIWRFDNEVPFRIAPTVSSKYIFAQTLDNTLFALDANSGHELWKYKSIQENTTLVGGASPAFDEGLDVVVAAFSNGELRAIKASTGTPLWSVLMVSRKRMNSLASINTIKANPVINDGVVYAAGNNHVMMAIDLRTGTPIWEREISCNSQPWVAGKVLYALSNDANLFAIEKKTGRIIWSTKIPLGKDASELSGAFASGPVLTGYRLIVTSSKGYAFAVSPFSGKILGFIDLDEEVNSSPIVAEDIVLFTTNDAELIAYK